MLDSSLAQAHRPRAAHQPNKHRRNAATGVSELSHARGTCHTSYVRQECVRSAAMQRGIHPSCLWVQRTYALGDIWKQDAVSPHIFILPHVHSDTQVQAITQAAPYHRLTMHTQHSKPTPDRDIPQLPPTQEYLRPTLKT